MLFVMNDNQIKYCYFVYVDFYILFLYNMYIFFLRKSIFFGEQL